MTVISGLVALILFNPFSANDSTFRVTHYGESFQGQNMGCAGAGQYDTNNRFILAAPPSRDLEWPCGSVLRVCYSDRCLNVIRMDSCPGCGRDHADISEAGITYLGGPGVDVLDSVEISLVQRP